MQKNIYGYIYLIKNTINNKVYIGQTTQSFNKRYRGTISNTHNEYLKRSILKYGLTAFKSIPILDIAYSKIELDELEIFYIEKFKANNKNFGFNLKSGGSHGKHSLSSNEKNRIAHLGKKMSREFCKQNSLRTKGIKNPFYGKKHSVETKIHLSKVHSRENLSNATLEKMRVNNSLENNPNSRAIYCITTNEIFNCIKEASLQYNVDDSAISKVCRGKLNWSGKNKFGEKLIWCYYDDLLQSPSELISLKRIFLKKPKPQIKFIKKKTGKYNPASKKIICMNTGEVFDCIIDAAHKYNLNNSSIAKACKGIYKTSGVLPNGEKMTWQYYDKYLKAN